MKKMIYSLLILFAVSFSSMASAIETEGIARSGSVEYSQDQAITSESVESDLSIAAFAPLDHRSSINMGSSNCANSNHANAIDQAEPHKGFQASRGGVIGTRRS